MSPWPDPTATALDRARAIARTYRDALSRAAPQACKHIDDAAIDRGEGWVCGGTSGPRACTVRQAAALLGITPGRVRHLIDDGTLPTVGKDRLGHVLFVTDVLAYRDTRSARRRGA